jgi:hypothetical protein
VGFSEAPGKLVLDARGWIEAANSQTRIVITVKIAREVPNITIRIWERDAPTPSSVTRQYRPSATMQQEIQISYDKQKELISVPATITLTFAKIFLRPTDPTKPTEQDITITRQELQHIAREVWEVQGFV